MCPLFFRCANFSTSSSSIVLPGLRPSESARARGQLRGPARTPRVHKKITIRRGNNKEKEENQEYKEHAYTAKMAWKILKKMFLKLFFKEVVKSGLMSPFPLLLPLLIGCIREKWCLEPTIIPLDKTFLQRSQKQIKTRRQVNARRGRGEINSPQHSRKNYIWQNVYSFVSWVPCIKCILLSWVYK